MVERGKDQNSPITTFLEGVVLNPNTLAKKLNTHDGLSVVVQNSESFSNVINRSQDLPLILLMSGTSESGKSLMGTTLVKNRTASRLKILRIVRELRQAGNLIDNRIDSDDPLAFLTELQPSLKENVGAEIVNTVCTMLKKVDTPIATIETISHPWLIKAFMSSEAIRVLSVYTDASLETRIKRESEQTGIPLPEITHNVKLKDEAKSSYGLEDVKSDSDIVVMNNGNLQTYIDFINSIGKLAIDHTRSFAGTPIEYK